MLQADFRLALTGTPIENHLGELWSLFRLMFPGLLGSWDASASASPMPIEKRRGPAARSRRWRADAPFILRRTKAEVAPELPAAHRDRAAGRAWRPRSWRLYEELRAALLQRDRRARTCTAATPASAHGSRCWRRSPACAALLPPAPARLRRRRRSSAPSCAVCSSWSTSCVRGRPQGAGLQPVRQLPRDRAQGARRARHRVPVPGRPHPGARRAPIGGAPSRPARRDVFLI